MEYFDVDALAEHLGKYEKYVAVFGAVCMGFCALKTGIKVLNYVVRTVKRSFSVDLQKYGRWAVITGSTDGIGKAYAKQMAEKGMDVVLIGRSAEKLAETAREIGQHTNVQVKTITVDFKKTDIYDHIKKELDGLDIGILVNNVGMSHHMSPCYFWEPADFEQFNVDIVNVNVISYVMMTSIVLPEMLERKRGYIINVASGIGLRALPFYTTYGGTKAFVCFFTEALNSECHDKGVTVQLVLPNMVNTNMVQSVAKAVSIKEGLFCPSADDFVKKAMQTIGRESVTAPHWPHELQQYPIQMLPDCIIRCLLNDQRKKMANFLKKQ